MLALTENTRMPWMSSRWELDNRVMLSQILRFNPCETLKAFRWRATHGCACAVHYFKGNFCFRGDFGPQTTSRSRQPEAVTQ